MSKIAVINLENGYPLVEDALKRLKNGIDTAKMSGARAVVVIHGYGSSGSGGAIKSAVVKSLANPAWVGTVQDFAPGEAWESRKAPFLAKCPGLKEKQRLFSGNPGVTVVLLK